jgi:hypothetical protein
MPKWEEPCEGVKIGGRWFLVVCSLKLGPQLNAQLSLPVQLCKTSSEESESSNGNGKPKPSRLILNGVLCKYPKWIEDRMREFRAEICKRVDDGITNSKRKGDERERSLP